MAQKAGTQGEENNRQYFQNKVQTPFHKSNWIGLSPLNKENQIHYRNFWNRCTSDNESNGCPQSKSGPESSPKRKRKRRGKSQVAENSSKRIRGQSQMVEMFTPQHQSTREHSNDGNGMEYSTRLKPPFQDRRFEPDVQGYGVMNVSAGHYSHTEFQLPPPPPVQNNSRASSWLGPDIPNGEKWGSTESGGFGEMFPPGTPFEYHKSAQRQSHSNQIRHDYKRFSGAQVDNFNLARGSVQRSFEKLPHRHEDMMASDVQSIYCLPETIDLTTPDSAQRQRKFSQMSTISGSSRNKRGLEMEPMEVDDWDSEIQDYKSARMQTYVPFGTTESDTPDVTHSEHRVKNTLHSKGNGYPSQYTQYDNGGKHHSNATKPNRLIRKKHPASIVPVNSFTVLRPSDFHREVKVANSYNDNVYIGESLPHRIRKASSGLNDNGSEVHGAIDYSSEYESNDTMEEMLRKQRLQKENSVMKDVHNVSLKQSNMISNSEEESHTSTLLKIRSSENSKTIGHLQVKNISSVAVTGDASRPIDMKGTAAKLTNESEKREEQRRQKLAAETIAQREKKAKISHSVEALFEEEETIDEVKLARIKRAKEVDKMKKQFKEDARIVEEGSRLTQEKLEAARKMREAEDLEERRAEKMRRVEGKRQLDSKKEEERLNAKRRIATQALKLQRLQDEEARNEVLNKLRAERVASKKYAAALQAFKKSDISPTSIEDVAKLEHPKRTEDSDTMSDGGMFVHGDDSPFPDVEPIERSSNDDKKENVDPSPVQQAERISIEASHTIEREQPSETNVLGEDDTERPSSVVDTSSALPAEATTSSEDSRDIADKDQSTVLISDKSKTKSTIAGVDEIPAVLSNLEKPIVAAVRTGEDSITSAAQVNMSKVTIMIDEVDHSSNSTKTGVEKQVLTSVLKESVPNTTATSIRKPQVSFGHTVGLSISTLASDGRRRPRELARHKPARANSPDRIRFTGKDRTTSRRSREVELKSIYSRPTAGKKPLNELMHNPDSQTEAKLEKILKDVENLIAKAQAKEVQQKKEWDDRIKDLIAKIVPKDFQGSHEKIHSQTSDAGKNGHLSSATSQSKYPPLTSQINFVSAIEAKEREKRKLEEARLAKFEKDKAGCRRRYDREIRTILAGQGIDQDEEKISKKLDEKMTAWEENRRKKARRESGDKDLSYPHSQEDGVIQSETEHDLGALQAIPSIGGDKPQELQTIENEKDKAMRAGIIFLASQNKGGNEFCKAASKSRVEEIESDESEEDPDDEPDTLADHSEQVTNTTSEESERVDGIEVDLTLNPAALKASIIPPLPEIPEQRKASTAFFPGIVNPKEEDMIHSYSVRHRASRENNAFDSVILGSFHSREEANEFARYKLTEFNLGPTTGKSETHDEDNLYIGEVTTNKDENHSETIWVTRDIVYIGDTANVKRNNIKAIIPVKVYNVLQIAQPEEGDSNNDNDNSPVGTIIATATIKSLANKKAADQYLVMMKPTRPRIDSMAFYNDIVIPSLRKSLAEAEEQDLTVDLGGLIPDTKRAFSITISENTVAGPLN